jgi:hypothetical protein
MRQNRKHFQKMQANKKNTFKKENKKKQPYLKRISPPRTRNEIEFCS